MRPAAHRILAALLLAVWLAPAASALAVGLHLALEHHEHEGRSHDLADLARAAAHGHHHPPSAEADHDHELLVHGRVPATKPGSGPAAVLPPTLCLGDALAERSGLESPRRRGPPLPLFTAHCSLLL